MSVWSLIAATLIGMAAILFFPALAENVQTQGLPCEKVITTLQNFQNAIIVILFALAITTGNFLLALRYAKQYAFA